MAMTIADVVGKGIPAALLMSNLQAAVRAFATETAQPADLCLQVNRILCGNIPEGRFISFFYAALDTQLGALTFVNAGHYPPVLVRADGSIERLTDGGPVLGVFEDARYEQGRVVIGPGDRLVLFTDGITEARRPDTGAPEFDHNRDAPAGDGTPAASFEADEFGEAQLIALAVANRACSAPALQACLADAVASFTGGTFQDDATLIVLAAGQHRDQFPRVRDEMRSPWCG
jgi:sigma-B regulation protein RsbU (phosphoserine phosphatase)